MLNYELLTILPGTLSDDEVNPVIEKLTKVLDEAGAQGVEVDNNEKRRLAYPIKQIRYGYFFIVRFTAESEGVESAKKKLGLMPEFLRVLIQKYDPAKQTQKRIDMGLTTQQFESEPRKEVSVVREVAEKIAVKQEEKEQSKIVPETEEEKPKVRRALADKKIDLEEIDKKLDEILDIDLSNV